MITIFQTAWSDDHQAQVLDWVRNDGVVLARVPKYYPFAKPQMAVSYRRDDKIAVWAGFECKTGSCDARHFLGYAKNDADAQSIATRWAATHAA